MGELPKIISEFIVRDLNYIIGGSIVLLSFLYRFGNFPDKDTPVVFYLFGAGVAYVIGYTLQDLFSIVRLVTTGYVVRPWWPMRTVYWLFTRKKWKLIDVKKFEENQPQLKQKIGEKRKEDNYWALNYERTISGVISAATMAPCFFVSGLMFLWSWCASDIGYVDYFALAASLTSFFLSAGLFVLARIRALQFTRKGADLLNEYK